MHMEQDDSQAEGNCPSFLVHSASRKPNQAADKASNTRKAQRQHVKVTEWKIPNIFRNVTAFNKKLVFRVQRSNTYRVSLQKETSHLFLNIDTWWIWLLLGNSCSVFLVMHNNANYSNLSFQWVSNTNPVLNKSYQWIPKIFCDQSFTFTALLAYSSYYMLFLNNYA